VGRNEFNSSFYTVLDLPPLSPDRCRYLLEKRGSRVPPGVARALGVIAAGNPREVLRLADVVESRVLTDDTANVVEAIRKVIMTEALEFRRGSVTSTPFEADERLTDGERVGVFTTLSEQSFGPDEFKNFAISLLEDYWAPEWAREGWQIRFEEEWRRLLVRIYVCGLIARHPSWLNDPKYLANLQDVLIVASQSAVVARLLMQERFRVEPTPA
jgi:hypothetical protein